MIEKDSLNNEIVIANRSLMIENMSNDNLKNTTRKMKLTKIRLDSVSIWLITFERLEIKISAFRRFVGPELAILTHYSKFKTHFISLHNSLLFLHDHEALCAHEMNLNNFTWIDALGKPLSNNTNPNSTGGCGAKLL